MTTITAEPALQTQTRPGTLSSLHITVRRNLLARAILFIAASAIFFAMYLALNWPHMGTSARLHWDGECCICSDDPMPNAAELAQNRGHIYDIAAESGSSDPAVITKYFESPQGSGEHAPLEIVRRYYSQISFFFARTAFDAGARWTHSPIGAVWFFQLSATITVSLAMALLLTFAIIITPPGRRLHLRLGVLMLAFAAIASQIIFLSIARQMLTETISLLLWVIAILLLAAAVNPRRSIWIAGAFAAGAGAAFFSTLRARYSLGPAVALILPLVLLLSLPLPELLRQWRRYTLLAAIGVATFAMLVAWDVHTYGPFFLPWVYNQTLVRSTYFYFHAEPPYQAFFVMLYNNWPLLVLPIIGVVITFIVSMVTSRNDSISPMQFRLARGYTALVLIALAGLITLMARQAVAYQGRHLFALSAAAVLVLLLTLGRINWGTKSAGIFSSLCLLVIALNVHSTFGPQRLIPDLNAPAPLSKPTLYQRWHSGRPRLLLLGDMLDGYYEWADVRRLHDPLIAAQFLRSTGNRPLLLIDPDIYGSSRTAWLIKKFDLAEVRVVSATDPTPPDVQMALSTGRPIYLYTKRGGSPYAEHFKLSPVAVPFDSAALWQMSATTRPF